MQNERADSLFIGLKASFLEDIRGAGNALCLKHSGDLVTCERIGVDIADDERLLCAVCLGIAGNGVDRARLDGDVFYGSGMGLSAGTNLCGIKIE